MIEHNYTGTKKTGVSYKNLTIHGLEGIHEHVSKYIVKNFEKNNKILILGSGTGAMEARLFDLGFKNITGVDINDQNYKYQNKKVKFIKVDLNENFSKKINDKFDLIIAIEIIEHLYSSYNFLKNSKKLIKENGQIIITTPNIHSFSSRSLYYISGYPIFFQGKPILYEHINPIFYGIFEHLCDLNQLKIYKKESILKPTKKKIINYIFFFLNIPSIMADFVFNKNFKKYSIPKDLKKGAISIFILKNKNI